MSRQRRGGAPEPRRQNILDAWQARLRSAPLEEEVRAATRSAFFSKRRRERLFSLGRDGRAMARLVVGGAGLSLRAQCQAAGGRQRLRRGKRLLFSGRVAGETTREAKKKSMDLVALRWKSGRPCHRWRAGAASRVLFLRRVANGLRRGPAAWPDIASRQILPNKRTAGAPSARRRAAENADGRGGCGRGGGIGRGCPPAQAEARAHAGAARGARMHI